MVSARGNATDELEDILNKSYKGQDYKTAFEAFKTYQKEPFKNY